MTFDEYQVSARRTQNAQLSATGKLQHAMFGLTSEIGEIASIFQHQLQDGSEIDRLELLKEIGDCLWFIAELCDACEMNMDAAAVANVIKLKKRYPEGFDAERSAHRHEIED